MREATAILEADRVAQALAVVGTLAAVLFRLLAEAVAALRRTLSAVKGTTHAVFLEAILTFTIAAALAAVLGAGVAALIISTFPIATALAAVQRA